MAVLEGDGPEGQPADGVGSIDDIADALIGEEESAPDEEEGSEAPDESEESETEADESDDSEDDEQEEATFTIKHDGKEVTLKQSELVEMAQQGFDYTRKTMAVAEERKAVESAKAQTEHARQYHEQVLGEQLSCLQALEQFYDSQIGEPPPVAWAQQDAAYYLAQKELYDNRKGQLEQARTAIAQLQGETQRQRQAWLTQQANDTEQALRNTLPGWNDDTLPTLAKYAEGLGLTPQTADVAFVQKGFWELVHKAKAFDALQAKKAELKPKEKLTKVVKPSAQNQSGKAIERAKREAAFNKNPSVDALAELLR